MASTLQLSSLTSMSFYVLFNVSGTCHSFLLVHIHTLTCALINIQHRVTTTIESFFLPASSFMECKKKSWLSWYVEMQHRCITHAKVFLACLISPTHLSGGRNHAELYSMRRYSVCMCKWMMRWVGQEIFVVLISTFSVDICWVLYATLTHKMYLWLTAVFKLYT